MNRMLFSLLTTLLSVLSISCTTQTQPPKFSFIEFQIGEFLEDSLIIRGPEYSKLSIRDKPNYLIEINNSHRITEITLLFPCEQRDFFVNEISEKYGEPKRSSEVILGESEVFLNWGGLSRYSIAIIHTERGDYLENCMFMLIDNQF